MIENYAIDEKEAKRILDFLATKHNEHASAILILANRTNKWQLCFFDGLCLSCILCNGNDLVVEELKPSFLEALKKMFKAIEEGYEVEVRLYAGFSTTVYKDVIVLKPNDTLESILVEMDLDNGEFKQL